ncbi:SEC10/PgrA surface exclusion domain-containing protein [Streptococcus suis]|uniref:SEC10/PgrA surface exclusion domain-containing protein n=1 Tax=Streptococcus suis TaxID=1307 RepID=UPI000C195E25|nr:SEC10/PgrA surface exclusion domain-containing protein [Streptococcus suis]
MEKKLVKGLAAVGLLTLGLGSVTTYAEETTLTPEVDNAPETVQAEKVADATVTAEQVSEAKAELDGTTQEVTKAQADEQTAQEQATQANKDVEQAQSEVTEAQALVAEVTPEVIAAQETKVVDTKAAVTQAEEAVTAAESSVTESKGAVTRQQTVVAEAEKTVSKEQADVDQAQAEVDNAQAILDGTGQSKLIAEKEVAEIAVAEAEAAVTVAEGDLTVAQEAEKTRAIMLDASETSLRNRGVDVANAKQALDQSNVTAQNAATALSEANKDLAAATQLVDSLTKELASKNTITVPSGYADALKAFAADKSESNKVAVANASATGVSLNQFKSLDSDKQIVISDVNNLSQAQRQELTLFAVDLMNQVRKQVGTSAVVANLSAISFADDVANTSKSLGHDLQAIPAAAGRKGLDSTDGVNYYENFSSGYFDPRQTVTMDDLKKAVYNTISEMLFDDADSNWGHSTSLAGVRTTTNSKYIGLDVSKLDYEFSTGNTMPLGRVHILGVADSQIEDASKFDTTSNLSSRNIDDELAAAKSAQSTAQATLSKAQTADSDAKAAQTLAQSNYNSALVAQTRAQEELSYWQNKTVQTPGALAALQTAKDNLTAAEERAKAAQDAVNAFSADVATKKANLDEKKAKLATQKAELQTVKANLDKEKQELENLQAKVTEFESTLAKAKSALATAKSNQAASEKRLNDLLNADDVLAKAQAKLDAAKATLAEKAEALEKAKSVLADLLEKQTIDQKNYDILLARFTAQEEAKRQAELEAKRVALETTGQVAIPVVDAAGKIVDYVAGNKPAPAGTTKTVARPVSTSSSKKAALPETGDAGSMGLLAVGLMTLFSAVGLVDKRKKG